MINEQLLIAARSNNSDRVYDLLNGRYHYHSNYAFHGGFIPYQDLVDINYQNEDGDTALMMACQSLGTEALKVLLEHEADVNMKDAFGCTALALAYKHGNKKAVEVLLDNQTEEVVNTRDLNFIFWNVCEEGDIALAQALLLKGADIESKDYDGNTALMLACKNGHIDVVNLLLQQGASIYAKNNKGRDALYIAHSHNFDDKRGEIFDLISSRAAEDKNRVDAG